MATLGAQARSSVADEKLAPFMQQKLLHSEKTLEGLAKGDFELITRHSQAMSLLCEDELWSVIQTPEYLDRSKEFQRNVNSITTAAREKNLEAATLAYVSATTNCVTCHKYLRQKR
jgi:cytochrome c556